MRINHKIALLVGGATIGTAFAVTALATLLETAPPIWRWLILVVGLVVGLGLLAIATIFALRDSVAQVVGAEPLLHGLASGTGFGYLAIVSRMVARLFSFLATWLTLGVGLYIGLTAIGANPFHHYPRDPQVIYPSPASVAKGTRVFVPTQISSLMKVYRDRTATDVVARDSVARYVGGWIALRGTVDNVSIPSLASVTKQDTIMVQFESPKAPFGTVIAQFGAGDAREASLLEKGAQAAIACKISYFSMILGTINLSECEFIR
jgi:hypothetical protein